MRGLLIHLPLQLGILSLHLADLFELLDADALLHGLVLVVCVILLNSFTQPIDVGGVYAVLTRQHVQHRRHGVELVNRLLRTLQSLLNGVLHPLVIQILVLTADELLELCIPVRCRCVLHLGGRCALGHNAILDIGQRVFSALSLRCGGHPCYARCSLCSGATISATLSEELEIELQDIVVHHRIAPFSPSGGQVRVCPSGGRVLCQWLS